VPGWTLAALPGGNERLRLVGRLATRRRSCPLVTSSSGKGCAWPYLALGALLAVAATLVTYTRRGVRIIGGMPVPRTPAIGWCARRRPSPRVRLDLAAAVAVSTATPLLAAAVQRFRSVSRGAYSAWLRAGPQVALDRVGGRDPLARAADVGVAGAPTGGGVRTRSPYWGGNAGCCARPRCAARPPPVVRHRLAWRVCFYGLLVDAAARGSSDARRRALRP